MLILWFGASGTVSAQFENRHDDEAGAFENELSGNRRPLPGTVRHRRDSVLTRDIRLDQPIDASSSSADPLPEQRRLSEPIEIHAVYSSRYDRDGESLRLLRGDCRIIQGNRTWTAPHAVLWELATGEGKPKRLHVWLEHTSEAPAVAIRPGRRDSRPSHWIELETTGSIVHFGRDPVDLPGEPDDALYHRAREQRRRARDTLQQTQYLVGPHDDPPGLVQETGPLLPPRGPRVQRRVTIGPRFLGERLEARIELSEASVPPEYVITVTGGVNIVVDNVPITIEGRTVLTRVDLTADRAVVWTAADQVRELGSFDIDEGTPFQVYLEGNIVVRQGTNEVRASHAFYDVNQRRGLALNAEVRTFLPEFEGTLRLRAAEVRQLSETNFHARDAWVTTSQFGRPKWRIEASDIFLEERSLGAPRIDPATGRRQETITSVTSLNNRLFVEEMPLFALPYLSGTAEDPNVPIRHLTAGWSGIFGAEIRTGWNMAGLFGLDLPPGTEWDLLADYLSDRGPAIGSRGQYDFDAALLGMPARHQGLGDLYYINDSGRDNLGLDRRALDPSTRNRGRMLLRNRSTFSPFTYLIAEVGHVFNNDRNFMEQYFEPEWDTGKDLENLLFLNHQVDNLTGSLMLSARSNNFENQTNWLPKADLTILGEPVFESPLIWSMHSSAGYAQLRQARAPVDTMADPFVPLDFFADSAGTVAMSRHELSLPFNVGPVKFVPYALGEVAHWQEDLTGGDLTRLYGSAGLRASVQFNKVMPHVRSSILGLNGLAHKVVFDMDYFFADASERLENIPQYNAFDENAQERFRSRFIQNEFGGMLPAMYDPRTYAVRSGAGRAVTAPYHELVDQQHTLWLGMRHRWQTKVGPPENQRIIDWMELDIGTAIFPNPNRDNFGETFGLITTRYAWHVSPRTSFLANGVFDVFDDGQQVWNVGVLSQRSARGSIYLGYRDVQAGPVDSRLITGSFSYVMTPNLYVATFGAAFDVAEGRDRGQSLTFTRIGESFLLHFGFGYDRSRDNVGLAVSLEPKFGSYGGDSVRLNSLLGIH